MDFALTDDQKAIREAAREFAMGEIDPIVDEIDEAQRFPREVIDKAGELGFLGILFPERYGGSEMGYVEYVLVITELSAVDPSVGITIAAHNSLCSNHIYLFGTEEQRQRWLVPLASGEKIGAWALTEPGSGSDAGGMRTQARRVDGGWVLNGSKAFITHATVGETCVVHAVTDANARTSQRISTFVLDKGMPGFRAGKKENKLGIRASDTAELIFEDCFVEEDRLLGREGEGFPQAMKVLDGGRISIAALGLGTARGAYDTAFAYAREREQFGQPIIDFQAMRFTLAEMHTQITAAGLMTLAAADEMDRTGKASRLASEAKLLAGEAAVHCSERGVQIHGGYGFIKDYRAEKYFRDSKVCTIGEGTSEIQRLVIARRVLQEMG